MEFKIIGHKNTNLRQQRYQIVPWKMNDILQLIFIIICYFLFFRGIAPFFKNYDSLLLLNIVLLSFIIFYLKFFIISKYKNGWEVLIESNNRLPHNKKIALFIGIILGTTFVLCMKSEKGFELSKTISILIKFGISALIIAPVVEELIFRSFIYRGLRNRYGVAISIIASSFLFSIYHMFNFTWPILIFGPVITIYYEISGSFFGCIFVHFTANFIYLTYLFFDLTNKTQLPYI